MTTDDLRPVWQSIQKLKSLFIEPTDQDEQYFYQMMMSPTTYPFIIDEGALVFFNEVQIGHHAFFGGVVWKDSLKRRHDLAIQVVGYAFEVFQLQKITSAIPDDNEIAAKYAEGLGFIYEGRIRRYILRTDKPSIDVHYYGMTQEEYNGIVQLKEASTSERDNRHEAGSAGLSEGGYRGGGTSGNGRDECVPTVVGGGGWRRRLGAWVSGPTDRATEDGRPD